MSVELEPMELGFRRPFQQEVSQVLRLRNPHSYPVAFKVKTTAPKHYCVRPNSGRIEVDSEVEVQVLLQAMKEDPPLDTKCRDKFLVQSVAVTADKENSNVTAIWQQIEQSAKSSIQEKKIRVLFLPADGADPSTPAKANGEGPSGTDASHLASSPVMVTPGNKSNAAPVGSVSLPESRPIDSKSVGEAASSSYNPAKEDRSSLSAAASTVTSAIPKSTEELQAQLTEAQNTIIRLKDQAAEGLRNRTKGGVSQNSKEKGTASTPGMVQQMPASGVPVQIVAALCLLSFLLAYFFF